MADKKFFYFYLVTLVVIGWLAYWNSLSVPFLFDDNSALLESARVKDLGSAFRSLVSIRGFSYLTFALNYQLDGFTPFGFHLINVAIHICSALVVFLLLIRLFPRALVRNFIAAAIFLVHPVQTMAVTYVVQRMAALAGLLVLLSLYCFLRAREAWVPGNWRGFTSLRHLLWYGACLTCAALAVLSKESAATIPFLLLLVAWYKDGDRYHLKAVAIYLAPLLLAVLCGSLWLALRGGVFASVFNTTELYIAADPPVTVLARDISFVQGWYIATQIVVLWHYLKLILLPVGQLVDYAYPLVQSLLEPRFLAALFGFALLVFAIIRSRSRSLYFGFAWFLLALSVESSIFPLDPIFEQRLYLPLFGVVAAFRGTILDRFSPRGTAVFGCFLILAFGSLTVMRNQLWNNPVALWTENLEKVPYSYRVKFSLHNALVDAGREDEAIRLAAEIFSKEPTSLAMKNSRLYSKSIVQLRQAYYRKGRRAEALEILQRAANDYPNQVEPHLYLGVMYAESGDNRARAQLQKALLLEPENQTARRQLRLLRN